MECVNYRAKDTSGQSSESCSDSDDDRSWRKDAKKSSSSKKVGLTSSTVLCNSAMNVDNNSLSVKNDLLNSTEVKTTTKRKKVNNIWCSVLEDQTLSDVFGGFNMEQRKLSQQDRSCETYDYTRKYYDTRPDTPDDIVPLHSDIFESVPENDKPDVPKKKQFKLPPKEYKIAKLLIRKLKEPKHNLIFNVVKVLGISKSVDLLRQTQSIEKNGGMMILNGSRKRTTGGVFFQLIKTDLNITKEDHDKIFSEDREINKRKSSKKNTPKSEGNMEIDENLPTLPTASDLFLTKKSSDKSENDSLEDGEICD